MAVIRHPEHKNIVYDFFATNHEKGAVDLIGGSVKRGLLTQVTNRMKIDKSVKEFAATARKVCLGTNIIYLKR